VHEAARGLGISEDAVRMRVKRGTLDSEREDGRLYVLLTPDPTTDPTDRTDELIGDLRDRVLSLEEQLREERRANDENRRLLLAALERIPALEAPQGAPPDARGPDEWATASGGGGDVPSEPQAATSREPWYRRWFG